MSVSYDYEALFAKAKMFLNRSMESGDDRSFDERALWASLALELLAKAALAKVSPILILDSSKDDGRAALHAAGLLHGEIALTTLSASTVFKRCKLVFRAFDANRAICISNARNEYPHGGGLGFFTTTQEVWWQGYWGIIATLVEALDLTMGSLVGVERVGGVEEILMQNQENLVERLDSRQSAAKLRSEQRRQGNVPLRELAKWRASLAGGYSSYQSPQSCPVCKSEGTIEGDEVFGSHWEEEEDGAYESLQVFADLFTCDYCRFVLDSPELIALANLPTYFSAEPTELDRNEMVRYSEDY